ncbi:hypothetical protein GCM10007866_11030 [Gluconobacter albidus]|uniref:Uncharacterized protein n=1 Tax=Gluconobacter albidus TaxID=318683 RepID=A0ABQ5WYR1_9PROT|nr:hypothetical protein AA3250_0808 [Gluconobacter albidus NBRC 3250]GLQ68652.1 hypothetical protein GCM10007866_11030 [Gluconobacter albidus]
MTGMVVVGSSARIFIASAIVQREPDWTALCVLETAFMSFPVAEKEKNQTHASIRNPVSGPDAGEPYEKKN